MWRIRSYYCAKWNCVTSNDGDWKWNSGNAPDMVKFSFQNVGPGRYGVDPIPLYRWRECRPSDLDRVRIQFSDMGKTNGTRTWMRGKRWGVVFYGYTGSLKTGSTITIRLSISTPPPQPVGPNPVMVKKPPIRHPKTTTTTTIATVTSPLNQILTTPMPLDTESRMFNLLQGAFLVLNRTNPNITRSSWLCYASNPPYCKEHF